MPSARGTGSGSSPAPASPPSCALGPGTNNANGRDKPKLTRHLNPPKIPPDIFICHQTASIFIVCDSASLSPSSHCLSLDPGCEVVPPSTTPLRIQALLKAKLLRLQHATAEALGVARRALRLLGLQCSPPEVPRGSRGKTRHGMGRDAHTVASDSGRQATSDPRPEECILISPSESSTAVPRCLSPPPLLVGRGRPPPAPRFRLGPQGAPTPDPEVRLSLPPPPTPPELRMSAHHLLDIV